MDVGGIDRRVIAFALRHRDAAGFLALAIVYGWFGMLKVLGLSPASPLVLSLLAVTLPWADPAAFLVAFGAFETLIGLLFFFPVAVRLTMALMALHMGMTFLPLVLLPAQAWAAPFVPTMEGQYILKNLVLLALGLTTVAATRPLATEKDGAH